jgi:hypothetical protein
VTKEELEELYKEGKCLATKKSDATYYVFSFSKDEHIYAVLNRKADIDWYKTDVLDLVIIDKVIKSQGPKYFASEMSKDETVQFHEKRPVSFNRSCYFKTEYDEYVVFMDISKEGSLKML